MRRFLAIHPDSRASAVKEIEIEVTRPEPHVLQLHYLLRAAIADLAIPEAAADAPLRADGLWNHTCFEAFIMPAGERGYLEFNFSPAIQFAAYAFDAYRSGMRPLPLHADPHLTTLESSDLLRLNAYIQAPFVRAPMRLGLAAIIEDKAGAKSYWALAHPPGKPDFHHADGFVFDLPDTEHA